MQNDLSCPGCGKADGVPVRVIERSRIERGKAVSRIVGKVYRCAHCTTEYCTGPDGVYQPKPPRPAPREMPDGKRRDLEAAPAMRDRDQAWD